MDPADMEWYFNRHDLKSEYRFLFEFVHNVFFSYLGSNESVTLSKFKLLIAVVKQLHVNWARLLVNLFIKEAAELPVRIKANMQLRHGTKLSIILQRTLTNRVWRICTGFPDDKLVPHTCNQLIMILGILPHKINKAKDAAKLLLIEMRDSKVDVAEEDDSCEADEEDIVQTESVRKGKRKLEDLQSAPSQKRITRSTAATFVEADLTPPATTTQPASPQVGVKPAVEQSPPGTPPGFPSKAQSQAPVTEAPTSFLNSSIAVDQMLASTKQSFLRCLEGLTCWNWRASCTLIKRLQPCKLRTPSCGNSSKLTLVKRMHKSSSQRTEDSLAR